MVSIEQVDIQQLFQERIQLVEKLIEDLPHTQLINDEKQLPAEQVLKQAVISSDLKISTKPEDLNIYMVTSGVNSHNAHVDYNFPLKGNKVLLKYHPKDSRQVYYNFSINSSSMRITIPTHYSSIKLSERVENDVKYMITKIFEWIENTLKQVIAECEEFNNMLLPIIQQKIEKRRIQLVDDAERKRRINPFLSVE